MADRLADVLTCLLLVLTRPWPSTLRCVARPQPQQLTARLEQLAAQLPGVAIEPLVAGAPALLTADVEALLEEVRRLVPGRDAVAFLAAQTHLVLDMDSGGLPSSLEMDGIGLDDAP